MHLRRRLRGEAATEHRQSCRQFSFFWRKDSAGTVIYTCQRAVTFGLGALVWHVRAAEIMAMASAPIGAAFTLLALVTGSLWGRPTWGTYWVWDARLTSELVLLFLYLGVMALYNAFDEPRKGARAAALLTLVGLVEVLAPEPVSGIRRGDRVRAFGKLIRPAPPDTASSVRSRSSPAASKAARAATRAAPWWCGAAIARSTAGGRRTSFPTARWSGS